MAFMDLLRPKWKHSNWEVRHATVARLTDQAVLAEVAKADDDWNVRGAALENGVARVRYAKMPLLRYGGGR